MSCSNEIKTITSKTNYGLRATLAQILATVAQSFLLMGLGMELSIPTIVIQSFYQKTEGNLSLTENEISWYGSILLICHPTGSFLSGFLQEKFGRKRCMIFANIPSIIGWFLLHSTHSVVSLYASTIMMGLSIGFSEAPIISYVGEIAEPRLRGSLTSMASAAAVLGSLIIFVLGLLYEWRMVALLGSLCPITCICVVTFIPESPIWLVSKGKIDKAEEALCWLRGWVHPDKVKAEHLDLINYNEVSGSNGNKLLNAADNKGLFSKLSVFKDPSVYRPLRLVMVFFFFSNVISLWPCKPFLSKILLEAGISNNQSLIMASFSVFQLIGCVTVISSISYTGKRAMALLVFSVNMILILLFALYVIAMKNNYIISKPYIPITLMCSIYLFGSPAMSLPWMLMSEIFQNKSRGIASGTCGGLTYLMMFVLTKLYLPLESLMPLEYTFIVISIIGVFAVIFIHRFLPETENKTLLEIEKYFT